MTRKRPNFTPPAHDLQFFSSLEGSIDFLDFEAQMSVQSFQRIASTFSENIKRAMSTGQSLPDMVFWCFYLGKFDEPATLYANEQQRLAGITWSLDQWNATYFGHLKQLLSELTEASMLDQDRATDLSAVLTVTGFSLVLGKVHKVQASLESILWQMLVAYWTAFETLANDAWVEVLNLGPIELARNALLRKDSQSSSDPAEADLPQSEGRLRFIYDMIQHEETIPAGTLLKWSRRFSFLGLDGIKEAYGCAFRSKWSAPI